MEKSVVLAMETSGRTGSVAAGIDDEMLAEIAFSGLMRHNAELLTSTRGLLEQIGKKPADIEHIYISTGPGSFTGLRIAVTTAKMMALANNARIVAVNTMDALSANATEYETCENAEISRIATIIDAKRGQFFAAVFEKADNGWAKVVPDCLITAARFVEQFGSQKEPVWLLGEGLVYYKQDFCGEGVRFLDEKYWPGRARNVYTVGRKMAKAGEFADPETLVPCYLRQPDAVKKQELKRPGIKKR